MKKNQLSENTAKKIDLWLHSDIDAESKFLIKDMIANDPEGAEEAFYKDLKFGTGGMRGIMGVGSNRMNIYTVGMATQGLSDYVKSQIKVKQPKAVIAYDCRNNSKLFAETTAKILSANGLKVYLFDKLRPTPELSFAIRHLGCHCGVMITASHNPKEYNGYKVYWEDGGQIISPHDEGIIEKVKAIRTPDKINFDTHSKLIHSVGEEVDKAYMKKLSELSLSPDAIKAHHNMPIVYTPLHGTGVHLVPEYLKTLGFTNIIHVPEQDVSDGNFPTVESPNPEESAAFDMAMEKAKNTNAELVMGTDPDGDRVGVIVRKNDGAYHFLNGNQTASILYYYVLCNLKQNGNSPKNGFTVKTIVTSELLAEISESFDVKSYDTLTGFKYIAAKIRECEGEEKFIIGGEESYGYLAADFVRDKDAVMSCGLIAEAAAWARSKNKTLYDILVEIYLKYGFYKEELVSIKKEGKSGEEAIKRMMGNLRDKSPESIDGVQVTMVNDFLKQQAVDKISDLRYDITLPKSNVLQFLMSDGTKISIRPSGTEPKIKFYVSVRTTLDNINEIELKDKELDERIDVILKSLIKS
ncbi:MAG: phospho-sugar mutase [Candidatus Delongbacteria bacterium]|jgi:phosphoglucomutase|nr:phospho-sugar mutase [Candidatus Delongbacteria bacterium]